MSEKDLVPPGLNYLADNIKRRDNILGVSKQEGAKWAEGLNLLKEGATFFFAGCGYQFESKLESLMGIIRKMDKSAIGTGGAMKLAGLQKSLRLDGVFLKMVGRNGNRDGQPLRDAIKVLRRLGINPGYLAEDEPCCGGLLYYMGEKSEFDRHSREVQARFKARGIREIISMVPSCTYTLRVLMREAGKNQDLKVRHFCEILAERITDLRLRFPKQVKITYHDPCQLVRYLGLVEEPRKILRAIKNIELVEPVWTCGEWATCCGGGGGFEAVFPEISEMLAKNRVKELLETGASIIVTHCPGCIMQLEAGLKALKIENVQVYDLASMVAMSLEGESADVRI